MAAIVVTNVQILNNPATFLTPFQLEITFECIHPGVKHELEWKLIYVGSADDQKYDQQLDSVLVGPVQVGKNKFVFRAPPPNISIIPNKDILEVTVLLLTCSYRQKEFIRVGWYVNNDYGPNDALNLNPPGQVDINLVYRNILADKPRVTRFAIPWDNDENQMKQQVSSQDSIDSTTMDMSKS